LLGLLKLLIASVNIGLGINNVLINPLHLLALSLYLERNVFSHSMDINHELFHVLELASPLVDELFHLVDLCLLSQRQRFLGLQFHCQILALSLLILLKVARIKLLFGLLDALFFKLLELFDLVGEFLSQILEGPIELVVLLLPLLVLLLRVHLYLLELLQHLFHFNHFCGQLTNCLIYVLPCLLVLLIIDRRVGLLLGFVPIQRLLILRYVVIEADHLSSDVFEYLLDVFAQLLVVPLVQERLL